MQLTRRLLGQAHELGAAGAGVADADPFSLVETSIEARVEAGQHADMAFTFSSPARSTDVRRSYPWAQRLLVVAWAYLPQAGTPVVGPDTGRVARFATEDHYVPLRVVLEALAVELEDAGYRSAVLVDDNRLVDRAAAVRAGVGWWGKNTMVLMPGYGPWVLLGSVITDAPLTPSAPMKRDCGKCSACLPACPTGALVAPGVLDARLCLAYWLQAPGVIPRPLRRAVGDRLYGCDDCIEACPPGSRLVASSTGRRGDVDLIEILLSGDDDLLARFGHFYIPRRQPRYLRRNALVALGNSGSDAGRSVAVQYLGDEDWLLRAHAAWAIGELGGPEAQRQLDHAAAHEDRSEVKSEIDAAQLVIRERSVATASDV